MLLAEKWNRLKTMKRRKLFLTKRTALLDSTQEFGKNFFARKPAKNRIEKRSYVVPFVCYKYTTKRAGNQGGELLKL